MNTTEELKYQLTINQCIPNTNLMHWRTSIKKMQNNKKKRYCWPDHHWEWDMVLLGLLFSNHKIMETE